MPHLEIVNYSYSLSFNLALNGVDDQRHAAATLLRLREPGSILQKAGGWLGFEAGLDE
jgi:hypothetical protein